MSVLVWPNLNLNLLLQKDFFDWQCCQRYSIINPNLCPNDGPFYTRTKHPIPSPIIKSGQPVPWPARNRTAANPFPTPLLGENFHMTRSNFHFHLPGRVCRRLSCPESKTPRFSCRWGYVRRRPILQPVWWNSIPFAAVEPLSKFTNTHTHIRPFESPARSHWPFRKVVGEWRRMKKKTDSRPARTLLGN